MKALILIENGNTQLSEVEKPVPIKNEVLIRLKSSALNRRDQWIRQGMYPNIKLNTILGSDGAGVVEAVGDGVSSSQVGREVVINPNINWGKNPTVQSTEYNILGMPKNGTLAQYVVVNHDRIHAKPAHLSWAEAGALPLGGLTAFRALFTHGKIQAKDNVLISGVGGGVAQFAFQFAAATRANVYVTSGNDSKIKKCEKLGAKGGFNYKKENWQKEALKITGGFDLVIDSAGGDQINDFINMMKPAGRIVFYGATNGLPKKVDLFKMFWNQITLKGSTMGNDEEFEAMLDFVQEHKIKPIIDSIRSFDEVTDAFDQMKEGDVFGKLVLSFS